MSINSKTTKYGAFENSLDYYNKYDHSYIKFLMIQNNACGIMSRLPLAHELSLRIKLCTRSLLLSVKKPDAVVCCDLGTCEKSEFGKIQKLANDLRRAYKSSKISSIIYHDPAFVQQLVRDAISINSDVKQRAQFALLKLEKADPFLSSINYQISCLNSNNEKSQTKTFQNLNKFIKSTPEALQHEFPIKPHKILPNSIEYHKLLNSNENSAPVKKKEAHDSFWKIEQLLFGLSPLYIRNLKEVAEAEGFNLKGIGGGEWLRDPLLLINENHAIIPIPQNLSDIKNFEKLVKGLTGDQQMDIMASTENADLSGLIPNIAMAPFTFDGGNLTTAINQYGDKIYLSGSYNVLHSLLISNRIFRTNEKKKELWNLINSLENSKIFSEENISLVLNRLNSTTILSNFLVEEEKKMIAKITLAICEHIQKSMAETLNAPVCILGEIFKPQPGFHLDLFLLPAPGGIVFLQDDDLCCKVIDSILLTHHLDEQQKERLASYKANAEKESVKWRDTYKQMAQNLELKGFKVISVPGVYHSLPKDPTINYMNAIVGMGKNGTYCLTNGSSHSVDRYLQDAFALTIKQYGIDNTYYIGRETKAPSGARCPVRVFEEAAASLGRGGGIHCRTQEIHSLSKESTLSISTIKEREQYNQSDSPEEALSKFYKEMLEIRDA